MPETFTGYFHAETSLAHIDPATLAALVLESCRRQDATMLRSLADYHAQAGNLAHAVRRIIEHGDREAANNRDASPAALQASYIGRKELVSALRHLDLAVAAFRQGLPEQ